MNDVGTPAAIKHLIQRLKKPHTVIGHQMYVQKAWEYQYIDRVDEEHARHLESRQTWLRGKAVIG